MTITNLGYISTYFLFISDDDHTPSANTDIAPTTATDMNQYCQFRAAWYATNVYQIDYLLQLTVEDYTGVL